MKILTVAIPCYNSEAYMSKCIESLLPGGDDVEILQPSGNVLKMRINEMYDEEGDRIESAPHAQQSVKIKTENTVEYFSMIRREAE